MTSTLVEYPDASWGLSQALTAARFVEWCLRDYGVRIPEDNRLRRAAHIVDEANQVSWDTLPTEFQRDASEATRTIMEQYMIVRAVTKPDKALRERLRWLLKGEVRPGRKSETQPYDVQFELLVGASLTLAGIEGVRMAEPDWRILAGTREIGITAKRIASVKSLTKRVRRAIGQIRRHGSPGVILLNLDSLHVGHQPGAAAAGVTGILKAARQLVATLDAEDSVFCLFGFATTFEWFLSPVGGALGVHLFSHGEVIANELSEAPQIRAWFDRLGRNVMRSITHAMSEMPEMPV